MSITLASEREIEGVDCCVGVWGVCVCPRPHSHVCVGGVGQGLECVEGQMGGWKQSGCQVISGWVWSGLVEGDMGEHSKEEEGVCVGGQKTDKRLDVTWMVEW